MMLLLLFSSHLPIGPQPYPVIYVVANPVRDLLLDRKRSEEHLPSSNESKRKTSRAYVFGREMVCSQKSVRNRNFFENAGHVSFSFCQTGSEETHTKPRKTSPQGTSIKRPAIYWDHAVSWGGGVWVSVSDIGRVGKK